MIVVVVVWCCYCCCHMPRGRWEWCLPTRACAAPALAPLPTWCAMGVGMVINDYVMVVVVVAPR